jgi:hypothetical protein
MAPLPVHRQTAARVTKQPAARPVVAAAGRDLQLGRRGFLVSLGLVGLLTNGAEAAPVRGDAPPLTAFEVCVAAGCGHRTPKPDHVHGCSGNISPNLFT